MSDDQPLTARERLRAISEAERVEAYITTIHPQAGWWSMPILRACAKVLRWCAQDHRDYDDDID